MLYNITKTHDNNPLSTWTNLPLIFRFLFFDNYVHVIFLYLISFIFYGCCLTNLEYFSLTMYCEFVWRSCVILYIIAVIFIHSVILMGSNLRISPHYSLVNWSYNRHSQSFKTIITNIHAMLAQHSSSAEPTFGGHNVHTLWLESLIELSRHKLLHINNIRCSWTCWHAGTVFRRHKLVQH